MTEPEGVPNPHGVSGSATDSSASGQVVYVDAEGLIHPIAIVSQAHSMVEATYLSLVETIAQGALALGDPGVLSTWNGFHTAWLSEVGAAKSALDELTALIKVAGENPDVEQEWIRCTRATEKRDRHRMSINTQSSRSAPITAIISFLRVPLTRATANTIRTSANNLASGAISDIRRDVPPLGITAPRWSSTGRRPTRRTADHAG